MTELTVGVRIAWWLKFYLFGVAAMARLTGRAPDDAKVNRVIRKAVRAVVT